MPRKRQKKETPARVELDREFYVEIAGEAYDHIKKRVSESGGDIFDALLVVENLVFGFMLAVEGLGVDRAAMFKTMVECLEKRFAHDSLLNEVPSGHG